MCVSFCFVFTSKILKLFNHVSIKVFLKIYVIYIYVYIIYIYIYIYIYILCIWVFVHECRYPQRPEGLRSSSGPLELKFQEVVSLLV
jgi:hypothetical protein